MKNLNKQIFRAFKSVIVATALIFSFSSCESNDNASMDTASKMTLNETIISMRNGAPAPTGTPIAGIAVDAGFNELVSALVYVDTELNAGLVDLFSSNDDQYTVFAPTDAAFQNLYTALNITSITDLPPTLVLDVLKYHVTNGRRASNSVVPRNGMRRVNTLLGESFYVTPGGSINAIGNTSSIIMADISASNGIIHVIDTVLLPIE